MPIIIDEKQIERLERAKRKKRKGKSVRPSHKVEREMRSRMTELWRRVLYPTTEKIKQMVREGASPIAVADEIELALKRAEFEYSTQAEDIVWRWKLGVDIESRRALQKGLSKSLGVDISAIVDSPVVADAIAIGTLESAQLIKSIPQKYLGEVARAVADNYSGVELPAGRSLLQQIQHIGKTTKRRTELIARDQTSKLTGMVNEARQQAIGVEEYIWRTSKDERVVGKPGGLYPDGNKMHGDHFHREGKRYRWDNPPADGHPGSAINCRCHAEPVIHIDKILEQSQRL